MRGNGLLRLLKAPWKIAKAIMQARKVIKKIDPDVVLGMGGYASGPGGVAAWTMGKVLILHEQNAIPGLTNKLLSKIAHKVFSGFHGTFASQAQQRPDKYQWIGNPVRAEIESLPAKQGVSQPLHILVIGGSLGARVLNQCLPDILSTTQAIKVHHQCGSGNVAEVEHAYAKSNANIDWQVSEFIADMAAAYDWADLVICRAGALTVAEVAAAGVTAIFVPLPNAVDDHQTENAASLASQHAAILLPQEELQRGELQHVLEDLFANPQKLTEMGCKAKQLAKLAAAQHIAQYCQQLTEAEV